MLPWRRSGGPEGATSEWCGPSTFQRHQHLPRKQLPDAGDGNRPNSVIRQLQLQFIILVAKIPGTLVRAKCTAPAVKTSAPVGTERGHAAYACAVDEDQPCRTGVGRHDSNRNCSPGSWLHANAAGGKLTRAAPDPGGHSPPPVGVPHLRGCTRNIHERLLRRRRSRMHGPDLLHRHGLPWTGMQRGPPRSGRQRRSGRLSAPHESRS